VITKEKSGVKFDVTYTEKHGVTIEQCGVVT